MTDCVVVRRPCCMGVVFVAVNRPDVIGAEEKRDIADLVMQGCTVEHCEAEKVRAMPFGCKCGRTGMLPLDGGVA